MGNNIQSLQKKYPKFAYVQCVICNIALAFAQVSVKLIHHVVSNFYAVVVRSIVLSIISYLINKFNQDEINIKNPKTFRLIIKRGFFNCVTLTCLFWAVNYAPIGMVSSLFYTSPIITPFIQKALYGHPVHKTHLILTIFSFIGIILIIKPPFLFRNSQYSDHHLFVYGIVLLGSFASSLSLIYLHDLKNSVKPHVALFHFYIGQSAFNNFFVLINKFEINFELITIGIIISLLSFIAFSFCAQYFMLRSLFIKKASNVIPFGYVTVMISFLADIIVFQQHMDFLSIIGMGMASLGLLSKVLGVHD